MGRKSQTRIIFLSALLALLFQSLAVQGQSEQQDSLVRLLKGTSLELVERYGRPYRKATDATFLHNGTYLICDTALWDVDNKIIKCNGNVQLIQEETILTSDRLDYLIEEDLAQFRGSVVQLQNRQENTLRTKDLDYNTRDSVAYFRGGASMKDKEGQIIECDNGTYDSPSKIFTFIEDVNMFTDSVFVRTSKMTYNSDLNRADFIAPIDFWKDEYMLSSRRGWYDRDRETFFFHSDVHALSDEKEMWCDTLYYYRLPNDVTMFGRVQVQDSTRKIFSLADRVFYRDSISQMTMERNAAFAIETKQEDKLDTLYCGADRFIYHTKKKHTIPEAIVEDAIKRLEEILSDPVSLYRSKAASERENNKGQDNNSPFAPARSNPPTTASSLSQSPTDTNSVSSLATQTDSLSDSLSPIFDSLAIADSISVVEVDSTEIAFLTGLGHVRMFRKDLQLRCDSLLYCDLDSIARFYIDPIIWNEGNRQYTSDSMYVLVRGDGIDRASLMSNAFIITQESETLFDQIKGTDALAFFDEASELRRFDALGGATALFYLEENDEFATVNKVESKMLSALMKNGELQQVFYFDSPQNDAYPIVQLPKKEHRMKGFNWQPETRPRGPQDITSLKIRPSERSAFLRHPKASFLRTDIYFPGYMTQVYNSIEAAKERARLRQLRREQEAAMADSLEVESATDSLLVIDSLMATRDSIGEQFASVDSMALNDSTLLSTSNSLSEREQKRLERLEMAQTRRALRIAARDARWARQDEKDAEKQEAKLLRKRKRQEARAALLKRKADKQAALDEAKLQKYIEYYEKQKAKNERKSKSTGERPQGAPSGGELSALIESE